MGDIKKLLSQSFEQWSKHNSSSLGAALAYYGVLSLAPLLTIAVATAGLAFGKQTVQNRVVGQVSMLVGPSGASAFREMLGHTRSLEANSAAIAIGLLVLLVTASGVLNIKSPDSAPNRNIPNRDIDAERDKKPLPLAS
jgi:membrane protein